MELPPTWRDGLPAKLRYANIACILVPELVFNLAWERIMRFFIKSFLLGLIFLLLPAAHVLAEDIIAGEGCAFHRAVIAANTDKEFQGCPAGNGADTIYMTKSIQLGGPLPITSDITIEGGGHTISGGGRNRIFHVEPEARLTIRNLRLDDGGGEPPIRPSGSSLNPERNGGAIFNEGILTLANSELSRNSGRLGGAVYNYGHLTIMNSVFSGNSAEENGGAIRISKGKMTISNSLFSGNSAEYSGGAISNRGEAIITNSEFRGNVAERNYGGAIWTRSDSLLLLGDNLFTGNSAGLSLGGGAIRYGGERGSGHVVLEGDNTFSNNSPNDCDRVHCPSVPGGGLSGPVGVDASAAAPAPAPSESADTAVVEIAGDPQDTGGSAASLNVAHGDLLGIEHVACTADDIYFILRLKSDTPVREHLLEVFVSTDGSAVLADILPMPKHQSLPDRLLSVVSLAMVGEGVNVVTGFPLAGSVFHAGAELTEWIDEQFTRSSSPLHFRLTWYNTDAHPGIERYLVHATRAGAGNLRVASRVAPLSEAASWANRVREQDTYSTLLKDTIDLAVYWMGGDPGGPGLENERADAAVDIIAKPLEWVADTVLNEPVAYFAERFFIEEGVTAEPIEIC